MIRLFKVSAVLIVLLSASILSAQSVRIPKGSIVQLSWIAPADTDVVSYIAGWTNIDTGDTTFLNIRDWTEGDSTNSFIYKHSLPIGNGVVRMKAVDRSGNESRWSDSFALYEVYDPRPLPPMYIRIKVF